MLSCYIRLHIQSIAWHDNIHMYVPDMSICGKHSINKVACTSVYHGLGIVDNKELIFLSRLL